jgi:hypothetical protein
MHNRFVKFTYCDVPGLGIEPAAFRNGWRRGRTRPRQPKDGHPDGSGRARQRNQTILADRTVAGAVRP